MCCKDKNPGIFIPDPARLSPSATPLGVSVFVLSMDQLNKAPFVNLPVDIPGDFIWFGQCPAPGGRIWISFRPDDAFGIDINPDFGFHNVRFRRRFEKFYLNMDTAQTPSQDLFIGISDGVVDRMD